MRRMMIPTTLATTSRNESKLKPISCEGRRRRRYMVGTRARLLDFLVLVDVLPAHRDLLPFEPGVGGVERAQPVGANEEAHLRSVRRLALVHRRLLPRDHLLHRLH